MRVAAYVVWIALLSGCAVTDGGTDIVKLSEWRTIGDPVWRFDGAGVSAGPGGQASYLVSSDSYSTFTLQVEFWIEEDTNSGVFIRCDEPVAVPDLNPDDCYEVNIWDNHPVQDFRTGSIVKRVVPIAQVDTVGKWNTLIISAGEGSIQVSVNDVVTATLDNAQRVSGLIALQYAGKSELKFRNLKISER